MGWGWFFSHSSPPHAINSPPPFFMSQNTTPTPSSSWQHRWEERSIELGWFPPTFPHVFKNSSPLVLLTTLARRRVDERMWGDFWHYWLERVRWYCDCETQIQSPRMVVITPSIVSYHTIDCLIYQFFSVYLRRQELRVTRKTTVWIAILIKRAISRVIIIYVH